MTTIITTDRGEYGYGRTRGAGRMHIEPPKDLRRALRDSESYHAATPLEAGYLLVLCRGGIGILGATPRCSANLISPHYIITDDAWNYIVASVRGCRDDIEMELAKQALSYQSEAPSED